jgi:2',3'-cyclic-nucleotide 2'-phosphodiesterase (5'-nucleotidase family)
VIWHGAARAGDTLTILFTHDLHSSFAGSREATSGGGMVRTGGYARLYTAIAQQRAQNPAATLLVDGGDVAMGTFFQTLFTSHFAEMQLMHKMGYEAVATGNHDFDFGVEALEQAIRAAAAADSLQTCAMVVSNLKGIAGVQACKIVEKAGFRIGIFGLLGAEAYSQSLIDKTLLYENTETAATRMVAYLRDSAKADVVLCLSHSGTHKIPKYSEDEQLARKVQGIDVIISGHSHSLLPEPLTAGQTVIVSAGAFGKYLGCLKLARHGDRPHCVSYTLVKIDSAYAENVEIAAEIMRYKRIVERQYLDAENLGFDEPVADVAASVFANSDSVALGCLIADAYRHAVQEAENRHVDVAVAPLGSVRENLYEGRVTTEEIFGILPLGVGADGTPGFPLVKVYLYGHELRDLCETDASLSHILPDAQLFFSGIRYTYYAGSLFCNKVKKVETLDSSGIYTIPEEDKLYSVTSDLYTAQLISIVKANTFGILSIVPKNAEGAPITDLHEAIVHDRAGNEIKGWTALLHYLKKTDTLRDTPPLFSYTSRLEEQKTALPAFSLKEEYTYMTTFALCVYVAVAMAVALLVASVLWIIVKKVRGVKS